MEISQGKNTTTIKVKSWEETRLFGGLLSRWLFRGQSNCEWLLRSSVERSLESRNISLSRHPAFELMVLSKFQEVAHNYIASVPNDDDLIGWLSLIQHFGGPTRFLDFTKSFYIASFFALDDAENDCSVWAINRPELMTILPTAIDNLANQIGIQTNDVHAKISAILHASIVGRLSENLVITASPLKKSERQFTQKGIALIPLNLQKGYMYTLLNSFSPICEMSDESRFNNIELGSMPDIIASSKIIKIILTNSCFLNARLDLNSMNLNAFTLFRGLDGLGKHLSDILNSFELYEKLKKS